MKFTRRSVGGLLVGMGIAFAGLAFVYAQTAADADFDGDGKVGFSDFVSFAGKFGTSRGDGRYEAKYDLDGDGQVGFTDFVAFAGFFGQSAVPNEAPILERIGDQGVPKGVTLIIELAASDPDGDDLDYRVSGQPEGSSLSGSTFRWTPTSGEDDTHRITFTVRDSRGGRASETITVRVVEFRFRLVEHRITTEEPSFVNILFQVIDSDNWGVTSLTTEHFEVREDDQVVSPTESAMRVQKREAIPHRFKLKTVLMLDTSTSVKDHLEQIKQAAVILVENMTENQEIALYEFSEKPERLQDFTNDAAALTKAIREIRLGFPTTNLYGSIITGTRRWADIFTTTEVQQGFLVILTDGSDTQGSYTLSEALAARGNKNVYTIGLGNEIDPDVLQELGNAGFFQITDVSKLADQLAERFIEIQKRIVSFADSFYWLRYLSPKRGDREHSLAVIVKGNEVNYSIEGSFNSRDFYSVRQGVFVNTSPSNAEGIEELRMAKGDSIRLQAVTFPELKSPQYIWETSDRDIVAIKPDTLDASVAWTIAVGDSGQTATLTVFDRANELDGQVQVHVGVIGTGFFALPGGALMEMVRIPPGTFRMGSPPSEEGRSSAEEPVHEVTIRQGFYLGKYEVTQAQWEAVMESYPSKSKVCGDCPAENLFRHEAQAFIRKLNEIEGENRYRLPSEAEWEYAARAGTTTRYSWGDEIGTNRANCRRCGSQWDERGIAPVGSFPANAWGLYDMHGNVREYVQDCWVNDYRRAPADGSAVEGDCSRRVARGGSWDDFPDALRSASRSGKDDSYYSTYRIFYNGYGFRVARTVPEADREALVALYNATDGDNWTDKTNWLTDNDLSTWFGVTVSNGRVTSLDLRENNLTGEIPPQLGSLTSLDSLRLDHNALSGPIPPELGNLTKMKRLILFSNQLSGTVPPELAKLSNLERLILFSNQLSGTVPPELAKLSNLKWLYLSTNQLSGSIPVELGNLSNLERLILSANQLSGEIPVELGNLSNLKWLYLSTNQLSGSIPVELGNLENLERLHLSSNQLSGTVPPELANLSNLKWLILSANQLSGEIPVELGNLSNLTHLYLYGNGLSGSIPVELGNLENLERLHLSSNQLSGTVPLELANLSNLKWLILSANQLSGSIPVELGNLSNLERLILSANQLSGEIPVELGNLSNLTHLYLYGNGLSGSIPVELGNLPNLTHLYLYGNGLSGSIPVELGNLENLERLHLSSNQLSGTVPPELANLSNLKWLILYGNGLSGSIPVELGNLPNLTHLYLSSNQLSGTVPPELANLSNLQWLWLNNNGLSGGIPVELGNLENLERLHLSSNQLSGTVPPELANLSNLQWLWLNNNGLSGGIPVELGNLENLERLYLHDNASLTGALPQSLTKLTKLVEFFFHATGLCAPLDSAFQTWLWGIEETRGPNCSS